MNEKFFDLKSEKQDRMINASLHRFAVAGYKHASTDDIIKEAEISKGLLFHYFGSKQGLYDFLIDYSVRYMLFEIGRVVEKETDYYAFHEKLELARLNVLRNYPYMYGFLEKASKEAILSSSDSGFEALTRYKETMDNYKSRLLLPKLKDGIDMCHIENLLSYTVKGITEAALESQNPDADIIYSQISEYIKVIKTLSD